MTAGGRKGAVKGVGEKHGKTTKEDHISDIGLPVARELLALLG